MIWVDTPEVRDNTLSCEIDVSRPYKKFFKSNQFIVEYDESIESVPDSILVIPAVMNVAPIAWASNIELSTPVLDERFYEALERVRAGYAELYPAVFGDNDRTVTCERTMANQSPDTSTPAVLFSGGVDSTAATLNVLDQSPALFTVLGSDISTDNIKAWQNATENIRCFAKSHDLSTHTLQSNFRDMLRYRFLNYQYRDELGRSYWGAVQYGTAIPALCAPITYKKGHPDVLQGSGYTADPEYPEAQPVYVDKLEWADTTVSIVDVDITRQEKLSRISQFVQEGNELEIRSCHESDKGCNCTECMKCRRTILGLLLENIDPNELGYSVDEETLQDIRTDFEVGEIQLRGSEMAFWMEFQNKVDTDDQYLYDKRGFFEWLANENLEKYESQTKTSSMPIRIADKTIQYLPYPLDVAIYDRIRPIGSALFAQN